MNTALIVMTILGCNDAGTDCRYIATAPNRWPSIAMCDAVSEEQLVGYANQPFPTIIAVCQNPQMAEAESPSVGHDVPRTNSSETLKGEPATSPEERTLAARAIQRVSSVLPTTEGVKTLMSRPVRLIDDGYSWVARKFAR